jgi:predicted ATPase
VPGADDEPIRELSPIRRRTRTLEVLRDWTVSSAERVPLALLFEDAHWADPSTLELLDLMASEGEGAGRRRLLCVTARPEFVPRWSGPHVHTIELARLNDGEIEAIATHVSSDRALPPLVLRRIAERSEGVPLFVEEVTKAVLESAALRLQGNRYELRGPLDEQAIPSTVHESLLARFDRLGESRSVAQLGAAIGREFSYALVHAVAGLSDDVLGEHLDRLCRSELAFAHGRPPHAAYSFKHALIQDAIYGTLIKRERARVHERIFLALQSNFPEVIAARPEMAAYHAESAGRRDAAVPLLRDAGLSALGRTAMAEAVKHLGHAIEIVGSLEEPERTALEMDLQAAIGVGYMSTLGWAAPEVERSSARLRDLALSRGDPAKLFQAVWGLWSVHFLRGELAPALEAAEQVLHMALMTSDPTLHLAGHGVVGYTHIYRGDYVDALMHAEAGLALFEFDQEKRLASMLQISPSVSMWNYASLAHWMMGFPERAAALLPSARSLAEELRHAPSRAYGHCAQFRVLRWLDRTDEVRQNAVIARSLAAAEGFELWVPMADIYIAWADARLGGDPAAACDTIRSSIAVMQAAGNTLFAVEDGTLLAEALLLAGRPAEVFDVVQATFDISRKGGQRHCEPELHRLRGQAAAALGDANGAERSFREGIESARAMGTKSLELRSAMDLFRAVGGAEGEKALRGVLDGFPEGHAAREFKLALSLLGEPERHHDLHAPPPG